MSSHAATPTPHMTTGKPYLAAMLRRGYAVPTLDVPTTLLFCHDAELAWHFRQLGHGCCNLFHSRHSLRIICCCCCFSCFALCRCGLHCSCFALSSVGSCCCRVSPVKRRIQSQYVDGDVRQRLHSPLIQHFMEVTVTPWCSSCVQKAI